MSETTRQIGYEADGVPLVGYFATDGGSDPGSASTRKAW
jgi:hypothetical protein